MSKINRDSLEQVIKEAGEISVNTVSPNFNNKNSLSKEQVEKILTTLSQNFSLERKYVLASIYLLFLKGVSSNSTPITFSVEVKDTNISKRDLLNAYNLATGNNYLRRLGEFLAIPIGQYAEANSLSGELSQRINTYLQSKGESLLSEKESAWCSSFSQKIPNLKELSSDRLSGLLAQDYQSRFLKPQRQNSPSPIPQGNKGKGKRKNNNNQSNNSRSGNRNNNNSGQKGGPKQ